MKWIPVCEIKVMFFSYKSLIPLLGSLFASVQISLFAETNFMDPTVFKSLDRIKTNTNFRTWAGSDSLPLGKCCFIERYKLLKKKFTEGKKKRLLHVESSGFQFLTLKVELAAAQQGDEKVEANQKRCGTFYWGSKYVRIKVCLLWIWDLP